MRMSHRDEHYSPAMVACWSADYVGEVIAEMMCGG